MLVILSELASSHELCEIFVKLHFSSELKMFREGFAMFVNLFILKKSDFMEKHNVKTKECLLLIEEAIRKKDSAFTL